MQAQQKSDTRDLEELLAAFKVQTAAKPLDRCQSELAQAAVLNGSKVVGGAVPRVFLHSKHRASSLPIGIPSRSTPSTVTRDLIQGVRSRVNGSCSVPNLASSPSDRPPIKTCLYKTEMCRGWEATGRCRYGSKCQFAHGVQEMQPVQRHPKYKTEICRTYAQTGLCRYGKRCRFIHPELNTELNLLPNTPPRTDHHTLYHSPGLCSQTCCSAIPSNPHGCSFEPLQPTPQYPGLHPAAYQDHFRRPDPTYPQASLQALPQYSRLAQLPYQDWSLCSVSGASEAAQLENAPYSALEYNAPEGQASPMMAHLSAAGTTDAVNAHLLGSGYSSQQSDGLMLAGTDGVQLETTPRGVLESAALQGGGYSFGRQGHSHLQIYLEEILMDIPTELTGLS